MKPFSVVLIICLGVIVYSNTFHCSFHFDDIQCIVDNTFIKNIHHLQNIWASYPCRFITFLSITLNYHFNGLNVFGYHLFNLTVHLCSAILVWWLVFLTLSTPIMKEDKITRHSHLIALFAGLVFISHPLQTEAVTYIWQRAASMAALFYLASLCFYIKSWLLQNKNPNSNLGKFCYISSLAIAVVAMFTKENTITLPFMILLYELCFFKTEKNLNWKRIAPFLLTLLVIPLTIFLTDSIRIQKIQDIAKGPGNISSMHYLLTQFKVMTTYVKLALFPLNQNLDYDYPLSKSIFETSVLLSLIFLIILLFWAKQLFIKYRLVSFSIFWFFLTLLPESSLLPQKDVIYEHRLYLPLVGYSLFLVSGAYYLLGKNTIKTMAILLTMIITFNSILTYQRNKIWKDDLTLWSDVIQKSPHKVRAYNGRGLAYSRQKRFTEAISDFNNAIKANPDDGEAYNNRGLVYGNQGNFIAAMSDFNKAIKTDPNNAQAYNNRGFIYASQGNFTQARKEIYKAIEINPNDADAYYNLGKIYNLQGRLTEAISYYDKTIAINPDYENAYNNRGSIYYQQGNLPQAIVDFNKAIELDPDFTDALYNRGLSYYRLKEYGKAWKDLHAVKNAD